MPKFYYFKSSYLIDHDFPQYEKYLHTPFPTSSHTLPHLPTPHPFSLHHRPLHPLPRPLPLPPLLQNYYFTSLYFTKLLFYIITLSTQHFGGHSRGLWTEHIWSLEAPLGDADKLKPHIALSNLSLPSDYAVAMVVSRLAHGLSAKTLASRYSLKPYLVSKITNMVTRLLATKFYLEFIKIPVGRRRLLETTQAFEELTSLPNMCGAIDTTPVHLRSNPNPTPTVVATNSWVAMQAGIDKLVDAVGLTLGPRGGPGP
ncbi:uncharacterized protein LOC109800035 [Cajanus cajan]|uniref:uncharacterized protein LOC109800035 n=1 Tax=Cajanus cajan TaxID=3821 RepID=UPI0010FB8651|nr:uncharacterized protein LOC109800035 [Cajanus cajan]